MSGIYNVKKKIEKNINNFLSTDIEWIPLNSVEINDESKENTIKFLETLEEDEDVQNVYTNLKF
jgi:transcriptional/translational regulatory protein YebC/TACO1